MGILIRAADLDADREALIDGFTRYLHPLSGTHRFDWLYCSNPDGQARVWVAVDRDTGSIVGSGTAIPRRMYLGGTEKRGAALADFWIHPRFRSLGPAVQLQRACMESVDSRPLALCYDFPGPSMVGVYKRLGIVPSERLVRLTKPLRLEKLIGKRLRLPLLAKALSALGNRVLESRDRWLGGNDKCTVSSHESACGEEFSVLAREVSASYGVCVARSAEYLNWRYRAHFQHRYEMLTARRDGKLLAYAVFVSQGDYAQIVDLFGVNEPLLIADLVARVVSILRRRYISSVNTPLLSSHPWIKLFRGLGFYPRESHPVVVYAPDHAPSGGSIIEGYTWFLTDADRGS